MIDYQSLELICKTVLQIVLTVSLCAVFHRFVKNLLQLSSTK